VIGDLVNGIAFGSLLFILASGFSLALGVIRVINIAHGAFYMLAAFLAITIQQKTGSLMLGVAASSVLLMLIGGVLQRTLLQRFHRKDLPQVLATYGLLLIIVESCRQIWGGYPQIARTPELFAGTFRVAGSIVPQYRAFLILIALLIALILWYVIERTSLGALVRAAVDDEEMARSMGVNVERLFMVLFASAGFLAGISGALGAPILGAFLGVEFQVLPLVLVVVVLGGLGSIPGALVGALLVGVIDTIGKVNFPELSYFVLFAPMVLMLSFRPKGLFGRQETMER